MASTQIMNPLGAFQNPQIPTGTFADGCQYVEFVAGGAITAGQPVQTNGATTLNTVVVTTGASTGVIGIALDTVVTGQAVRVAVSGVVRGLCIAQGGGVVAGTLYSTGAAGVFAAVSATIGQNIVVALQTIAATNPFDALICKC